MAEQIITIASVITALGVILGVVLGFTSFILKTISKMMILE